MNEPTQLTPLQVWEWYIFSLLIWRESRNQPKDTQLAMACSVRNRVDHPSWWGNGWLDVMMKNGITGRYTTVWQYSSMDPHDPNGGKLPLENDPVFIQCMGIAEDVMFGVQQDTVGGATHYYDKSLDMPPHSPPYWAVDMKHVLDSGAFHFFV